MRTLLLLILALPVAAQDAAPKPVPVPADDADQILKDLQAELRKASQEFWADYQEARKKDNSITYDGSKHPNKTFAPRFVQFAQTHAGTGAAVKAWTALLRMAPDDAGKKNALTALLSEDHIGLKDIAGALFGIRYAYWADRPAALKKIADTTTHHDVKGKALLQYGWVLKKTDPKQALEILKHVQATYTDVPYRGSRTVADQAGNEIFEVENLVVGKVAPDIVGEDIDGVAFKLSDYRGTVVFLDFWGHW